jgi:hypothetical protein
MTVSQLIAKLQQHPLDIPVMIGNEDEDVVQNIDPLDIRVHAYLPAEDGDWHAGEFVPEGQSEEGAMKAVVLWPE